MVAGTGGAIPTSTISARTRRKSRPSGAWRNVWRCSLERQAAHGVNHARQAYRLAKGLSQQPVFEKDYPQNYEAGGLFAELQPSSDLEAKIGRTLDGFARARRIEVEGGGEHARGILVTPAALKFIASGTVVAGKRNVRRILLINGAQDAGALKGTLDMFVTEPRGAVVGGESVAIGEVCWMPLLPPEKPGLYAIRFFATLDSGARLEARGLLTVIEDKARR